MKSYLIFTFLFLLLNPVLQANTGKKSTFLSKPNIEESASLISTIDISGKNIIIWENISTIGNQNPQIFAQKINDSGKVIWGNAVELTHDSNRIQNSHKLIPDEKGGVIITWEERSLNSEDTDIYAQHLDSLGTKLWGPEGIIISAFTGSQISPMLASDGAGGAIIVWNDSRNDISYSNWDIYAQHVNAEGKLMWESDGILVSADVKDEYLGKVLPDAKGGITIVWNKIIPDLSGIAEGYEFYFRKLNSEGEWVQTFTSENFLTLPASTDNYKLGSDILSDGNDGFFLSLTMNGDQTNSSLYLQHVLATGELAFSGTYGLLIDNSIYRNTPINFETDTAGNILVEWMKTTEDLPIACTQKFDSAGNPIMPDSSIIESRDIKTPSYEMIDPTLIAGISDTNPNTKPDIPLISKVNNKSSTSPHHKTNNLGKEKSFVSINHHQDTSNSIEKLDSIKLTFNYSHSLLNTKRPILKAIKTVNVNLITLPDCDLTIANLVEPNDINYRKFYPNKMLKRPLAYLSLHNQKSKLQPTAYRQVVPSG